MAGGDSETCGKGPNRARRGRAPVRCKRLEMTVMARVEHVGKGFKREREDEESGRHEHGKRDRREDRTEDKGDE